MPLKKKKTHVIIVFVLIAVFIIFGAAVKNRFEWYLTEEAVASGGYTYQIGLTNIIVTPCFTTGVPPLCEGGLLCYIKDAATCIAYSDVSGAPAGGMGENALFLKTALAQAGVVPGGQLIAGGFSPVLMESGVLAGPGGCYNCLAKDNIIRIVKNKIKYFFAGFKD